MPIIHRATLGELIIAEVEEGFLSCCRCFFFSGEIMSRDTADEAKKVIEDRLPIETRSAVVWSKHDRSLRYHGI